MRILTCQHLMNKNLCLNAQVDSKDSYRNDSSLKWQLETSCMELVVFMVVNLHIVDFKTAPRPALFTPRTETRCTLYKRLGGPQSPSELMRKMPPPYRNSILDLPARSQSLHHLDLVTCLLTPCLSVSEDYTMLQLWPKP